MKTVYFNNSDPVHKKQLHANLTKSIMNYWYMQHVLKRMPGEVLVEDSPGLNQLNSDLSGDNILFTVRTTMSYHSERLPVLFDTWLSVANTSNIIIVSDGEDDRFAGRAGEWYMTSQYC